MMEELAFSINLLFGNKTKPEKKRFISIKSTDFYSPKKNLESNETSLKKEMNGEKNFGLPSKRDNPDNDFK